MKAASVDRRAKHSRVAGLGQRGHSLLDLGVAVPSLSIPAARRRRFAEVQEEIESSHPGAPISVGLAELGGFSLDGTGIPTFPLVAG